MAYSIHVIRPPSITPIWLADAGNLTDVESWLESPEYTKKPGDLLVGFSGKQPVVWAYVTKRKIWQYNKSWNALPLHNDYGIAWNTAFESMSAVNLLRAISQEHQAWKDDNINTLMYLLIQMGCGLYQLSCNKLSISPNDDGVEWLSKRGPNNRMWAKGKFGTGSIERHNGRMMGMIIGDLYDRIDERSSMAYIKNAAVWRMYEEFNRIRSLADADADDFFREIIVSKMPCEKFLGLL